MNVSLILRHSRVDPQYRTIGAIFQADREEDAAEANAFLGPVGAHAIYTLAEDNLDRIPSILTTKTRRAAQTSRRRFHRFSRTAESRAAGSRR